MKTSAWIVVILGLLTLNARGEDVTKVPAYDQFVVIPLRAHVLSSKKLDLANCRLTDAEVTKVIPRINEIWHKAGIHFGLESIVREAAVQEDRFIAIVELNNGQLESTALFGYLLPISNRAFDGLHVYFMGDVPFNGAYIVAADAPMVNQRPQLRTVEGGTDDPLSRVAARTLGMAMGLTLRDDDVGLLSSATTGIGLSEAEVKRARTVARTIPGAMTVAAAAKEAEAAANNRDEAKARRLWTWLADVPGTGAADAKKRLANLRSEKP